MITIATAKTGQSETLPVSLVTTTVQELCDWSVALFGLTGPVHLFKDGRRLDPHLKLEQAGVVSGDLLAAQEASATRQQQQQSTAAAPAPAAGGLDFSSLLQGTAAPAAAAAGGGGGGLDFSNLLLQQNVMAPPQNEPVYYPGMTLNDAWDHNTNPEHIVKLLQSKDHLFKELNYHQPMLAEKIRGKPYEQAVQIWRDEILKGGIQTAMSRSTKMIKVKM